MSKELYKGVKFKTFFALSQIPVHKDLTELIYWCNEFSRFNLTPEYKGGSSGNLSFRTDKDNTQFIITASGINSKNKLSDECFVKISDCDLKNKIVYAEGTREPSSESMMHYAIYKQRKDINAIFHGHSDAILSNHLKLGIPSTEEEKPYGSIELINSISELVKNNNFFILKNHGFISLGSSMSLAASQTISFINKLT